MSLAGLRRRDLAQYYPEIVALALDCRFADCTHSVEPDCAVRAAAESGAIGRPRYDNYCKIWETLPE